jgi:dihydrofolate reductase
MGNVMTGFTMSLDGFIADPNDGVERLFEWYASGETEYRFPGDPDNHLAVRVSATSAELLREQTEAIGALVVGRRLFDLTNGWSGRHPIDVPVFIVTHTIPKEWVEAHEGAPFTFVTEGVERAVERARAVASDKNVGVGGADVAQQCIKAGLVDEIGVELVPVLLGKGIRFFDHLGSEPVELEQTRMIEGYGVTHLRFRVIHK